MYICVDESAKIKDHIKTIETEFWEYIRTTHTKKNYRGAYKTILRVLGTSNLFIKFHFFGLNKYKKY